MHVSRLPENLHGSRLIKIKYLNFIFQLQKSEMTFTDSEKTSTESSEDFHRV